MSSAKSRINRFVFHIPFMKMLVCSIVDNVVQEITVQNILELRAPWLPTQLNCSYLHHN